MEKQMTDTHIPVDHINAELRKIGRSMDQAEIVEHGWKNGEYGFKVVWADGYSAFLGFGPVGTAVIEKRQQRLVH